MRSETARVFFAVLLLGMISIASRAQAADETPGTDRFSREFDGIKTRLASLEEQQKQILANQTTILEKLDQLRIWVHRK